MFRDRSEALQQLEEALLEAEAPPVPEEEPDETLLSDQTLDALLDDAAPAQGPAYYQNYSNGYHAYNNDTCDTELEAYSETVRTGRERGITGLVILLCLLAAGIVCVLIFWLLRYGGFL